MKMEIEKIKEEKSKLELEIRDMCNAFMDRTKTRVDDIYIMYTTHNFKTGVTRITDIALSVEL
jgi:hypothetical protein